MINQVAVMLGKTERNLFLQSNICFRNSLSSAIHQHRYTEVHIVAEGDFKFNVNGATYSLSPGSVIMIPSDTPHFKQAPKSESAVISFVADVNLERTKVHHFPKEILAGFIREIEHYNSNGNFLPVASYISFVCAPFFADERLDTVRVSDYKYIIDNFFEESYSKNASLDELARSLHVSERQASRLVVKHTGHSFKQEMLKRKMESAHLLLKTSDLSMSEIAEHLGYSSYGSFWRSYQKYKSEAKNTSEH